MERDSQLRAAALQHVSRLLQIHGELLPWRVIEQGFPLGSARCFLASKAEGIYKPAGHPAALSIKTTVPRAGRTNIYNDALTADGSSLRYAYRESGGPDCAQNESLRVVLREKLPILYFVGVAPGVYTALLPMFVVGDSRATREFLVAPGPQVVYPEPRAEAWGQAAEVPDAAIERRYATRTALQRVHQRAFRQQVLSAYANHCAMCSIHFDELLDAAHIVPDSQEEGRPDVRNGLALCSLHHRAFDRFLIDVDDDYRIQLSPELQRRRNGPLFQQAFLERHGEPLHLPKSARQWPGQEFLSLRRAQRPEEHW